MGYRLPVREKQRAEFLRLSEFGFAWVIAILKLSHGIRPPAMQPMKHFNTNKHQGFFKPLIASTSAQAAMMVLKSGQSSSEKKETEHPRAEQWLFVISGSGRAKVGKLNIRIKTGSLLLIEKGEAHQITNTAKQPMITLNFYWPPAYSAKGDVKPAVK
jgi:mannose-6-phosphate isomerase-like protein (cupin superfamily)